MVGNLTVGKPSLVLWSFSVPMLLSMLFQQCYSLVDSIIAGKSIGAAALAAIGVSHPITVLFLAIASGSTLGASVVIGQLFGAGEYHGVQSAVFTATRAFLSAAIGITAVGIWVSPALLELLQTPGDILPLAVVYLRVYICGFPFLYLYNIATGTMNALGDSKTPLYLLLFSSALNILLDILFAVVFRWGLLGIAWATFLAQALVGSIAMLTAKRRVARLAPGQGERRFDRGLCIQILRLGIPSMLQQIFVSLGQMSIQGVINSYGWVVVAGYTAAFRINTLVIMAFNTLSNAVSAYCAQNIGAGLKDRVRQGTKAAMGMILCMAAVAVPILFLWREAIISGFLSKESAQSIGVGAGFLQIVSPFYFLVCFKIVADGVLRGIGAMGEFMVGTFADLLVRIVLSQVFYRMGADSAVLWWIWPLAWIVGTSCSVFFYCKKMRGDIPMATPVT